MYTPKHFEVTDQALLYGLMQRFSFATLVTVRQGLPIATHLPFLVEAGADGQGSLVSHMARANEQWGDFGSGAPALAIFQGPHAYISPSLYENHPSVPTWNYMVVHAYGVPHIVDDEQRVRAILRQLVDKHEGPRDQPWAMDLPDDYLGKMTRGIVAFEIPISRLEGKFKLSQNRPAGDHRRVLDALAGSADPVEQELGAAMRDAL